MPRTINNQGVLETDENGNKAFDGIPYGNTPLGRSRAFYEAKRRERERRQRNSQKKVSDPQSSFPDSGRHEEFDPSTLRSSEVEDYLRSEGRSPLVSFYWKTFVVSIVILLLAYFIAVQ